MSIIIDQFERHLLSYAGLSVKTYSLYKKDFAEFTCFLQAHEREITTISSRDCYDFLYSLTQKAVSYAHGRRMITVLKLFSSYIQQKHGLPDFTQEIGSYQRRLFARFPLVCTPEKIAHVLKTYDQAQTYKELREKVILRLLYVHGLSMNQLARLTLDSFCPEFRLLTKSKTKVVTLYQEDSALLRAYAKSRLQLIGGRTSPHLFPVTRGYSLQPLSRQALWSLLKKLILTKSISQESIVSIPHEHSQKEPEERLTYLQKHPRSR